MALTKAQAAAAIPAKVAAKFASTIGEMADELQQLRERKRELEAEIAVVEGQYKGIEDELLQQLEAQHTSTAKGKLASVSITSSVTANVTDWDKLYAFIKRHGHFHLLHRRVTDAAYRELLEHGVKVPGTESFVKKRLNVRTIS
jgi:acyl transferase domain-containing protein